MFEKSKYRYLYHKIQSQNNSKHGLMFHETTSHIVKSNKWPKSAKYKHLMHQREEA